nr:helicase-related protein [Paenibacillus phocaensis]
MKGGLYAIRTRLSWQLRVSLDLRVDLFWWMGRDARAIYLLSEGLPLGWAVEVRDRFKPANEMDRWSSSEWDHLLKRELQEELRMEARLATSEKLQLGKAGRALDEVSLLGELRGWLWKDGRVTELGRAVMKKGGPSMEGNRSDSLEMETGMAVEAKKEFGASGENRTGSTEGVWATEMSAAAQRGAAGEALRFLARAQEAAPSRAASRAGFPSSRRRQNTIARPSRFLLWAVTGAGKTEMIFPLLRYALDRGGRVLVATPRRDVVLELAPRIAKAFPNEPLAVLYGGSPQRWEEARLILATTHQLLRFHQAFDLVVIDELDAFPFHNDPMLGYAAEAACKPEGRFIFLSATPPLRLQKEIRAGRLPHAKVPARYHGSPLPVPERITTASVELCLRRHSLPPALLHPLHHSVRRGAQIFIFVTRIRQIAAYAQLLRSYFPGIRIEGTSSADPARAEKVLAFRERHIRMLVTTTILERGVTVPQSDVYIVDADSDLFDEASLVQMAGRAGRSQDDPNGKVVFAAPVWTKSQRNAIRQIRMMNAAAHKNGFLKVKEGQ